MSFEFEVGRLYNRQKDIHGEFGGRRQDGIVTSKRAKVIFAISDTAGKTYGYHDGWKGDVFEYFGRGRIGPMKMADGNKAISEHIANGKDLLLFIKDRKRKGLVYVGQMYCDGWEFREAPDQKKNLRQAIVFKLRRFGEISPTIDQDIADGPAGANSADLQRLAYEASSTNPGKRPSTTNHYERSAHVHRWVLHRANGICEGCGDPAPFENAKGKPYLEPHHVHRLGDGGPDHPNSVIALCPNCHRAAHSAVNKAERKAAHIEKLKFIETRQF